MKKASAATPPEQPREKAAEKPPVLVLATDTMTGDLRDLVLDTLKHEHNPLPWHMRKQDEQKATIHRVTEAMKYAVTRAVEMIAADGKRTLPGKLIKIVRKGTSIQTQVDFDSSDPLRHELFDSQGMTVMLAIADAAKFGGSRADVPINFDQGAMFKEDEGPRADLDKRKPPETKDDEPPADEPPPDEPEG